MLRRAQGSTDISPCDPRVGSSLANSPPADASGLPISVQVLNQPFEWHTNNASLLVLHEACISKDTSVMVAQLAC